MGGCVNKEPIGLYIFRFVTGFGLFAFMAMLYWSSLIVEENIKFLRSDIAELKNDVFNLKTETVHIREDVINELQERTHLSPATHERKSDYQANTSIQRKIDTALPNLLQEDTFYVATLPKLLGDHFKPSGTFQQASVGKPDNLHPFSNWQQVSAWHDQCTVAVAKLQFGKYETLSPDMALKVEERNAPGSDIPEYWVHLRKDVFWQPLKADFFSEDIHLAPEFLRKHPVTAHDFKFYLDALMNPHVQEAGAVALRNYFKDIEEVKVVDDHTFIVRWKTKEVSQPDGRTVHQLKYVSKIMTGGLRPLPAFVYQYFADGKKIVEDDTPPDTYRTNTVWAQNFSEHWAKNIIVSCGPWVFEGMTEREIRFKRNPDFYFPHAVLVEGAVVQFKDAPDAVWQAFKENTIDSYRLQPDQLAEFDDFMKSERYLEQKSKGDGIKRLDYVARSYTYIGWNQATPYFQSKKVRQALTMAIDRQRIIQQNLNGLGIEINGTFYRYSPDYDASITPWPYDLTKARQLLEEEGWFDSTGNGVIDKTVEGKSVPFRFSLTYFVKNAVVRSICESVATGLKELGIICDLHGVDVADLSSAFEDKTFDAICLGWSLGTPPEDPRQLWSSAGAKEKGSSNAIGFANKEVDAIIDALDYEYDSEKRLALYHRFDAIIFDEAPYTFLYTPKASFVYRDYLQNVFIPAERQDIVPGATVAEPDSSIFWLKQRKHDIHDR
jgi:peptide/nickel transport system substrate-binding protein